MWAKDETMSEQGLKNERVKPPVLDRRIGDFLELVYDKAGDITALPKVS